MFFLHTTLSIKRDLNNTKHQKRSWSIYFYLQFIDRLSTHLKSSNIPCNPCNQETLSNLKLYIHTLICSPKLRRKCQIRIDSLHRYTEVVDLMRRILSGVWPSSYTNKSIHVQNVQIFSFWLESAVWPSYCCAMVGGVFRWRFKDFSSQSVSVSGKWWSQLSELYPLERINYSFIKSEWEFSINCFDDGAA